MPHAHGPAGQYLRLSLALTTGFVVAEAAAGWWANSLALISDAGHNLADALALFVSWYAIRLAHRPADPRRTYGYHRAGILAALVNSVTLVLIALGVFWGAWQRFRNPEPVEGGLMVGVALAAVVLNGVISWWLHDKAAHDLNVRSAYLHMLGDSLSALGVAVAGAIVTVTGSSWPDPAVSVLIGVLILWSAWSVLGQVTNVLLEAAPADVDVEAVARAVREVPGVLDAHDLHVWTVASGIVACSCHVLVADQSAREGEQVLREVIARLHDRFGIGHTTVQIEVEGCDPNDMYCTLRPHRHENESEPQGLSLRRRSSSK